MKIRHILPVLPMIFAIFGCQSDEQQKELIPENRIRVKVSLPESETTRAIIEYGGTDRNGEAFKWTDEDCISIFNLSKFSEFHQSHDAPILVIDKEKINGTKAEFIFIPDSDEEKANGELFFSELKSGDYLLAMLGAANAKELTEGFEANNLFSFFAGSTFYDQKIREDINSPLVLNHVNKMLRMYDIVRITEDGKLPDFHFKHLSSIFRVTLRNETGAPFFTKPTDLVFEYPTGDDCAFVLGFCFFSVEGNEEEGFYLRENFKKQEPNNPLNTIKTEETMFLDSKATHKINENGGLALNVGETYEFYSVVVPRLQAKDRPVGDKFIINLYNGVESGYTAHLEGSEKYSITIDNFNKQIEPGKRYWFNLTAVKEDDGETKLMFTSQWEALQNQKEQNQEN